jgi:hypothetical protein
VQTRYNANNANNGGLTCVSYLLAQSSFRLQSESEVVFGITNRRSKRNPLSKRLTSLLSISLASPGRGSPLDRGFSFLSKVPSDVGSVSWT